MQNHHAGTPDAPAALDDASHLPRVVEATPAAMVVVGTDGRIVLANARAESLFGYDRAALLELAVQDLVPSWSRAARLPLSAPRPAAPNLIGVRKDGVELPVEIGLTPVSVGDEDLVLASVVDVRERLQVRPSVEVPDHDDLRRSILASMPCSVLVTDAEGHVTEANPAAQHLLGHGEDELVGLPLHEVHGAGDAGDVAWTRHADGRERERTYRSRDGGHVPVGEAIVPVLDGTGQVTGYLAVAVGLARRAETMTRGDQLAHHDVLTGLPGRSLLLREMATSLRGAQARGTQVALIVLGVDHFKQVNHAHGHQVGDELLQLLADRLRVGASKGDVVARLTGDELVVLLKDVRSATELEARVATLTSAFPTAVVLDSGEVPVSVSAGGVVYPRDGDSAELLLKRADTARYRAKAAGRGTLEWFVAGMLDETAEKAALSLALGEAMDRDGELTVVYQPTVDIQTGKVVGLEALSRWRSPLLGQVPPNRFIPAAEEGGMIDELGGRVLRQACADLVQINASLEGEPLRLAVNVSPRQFASRTLAAEVATTLEETGLPPRLLDLEITEGLLIEEDQEVLDALNELKRLGVGIVVDDFGQGHSNLAFLTRFPVDKLKIDSAFVWRLSTTKADAAVVDAIVAMAHALSMTVVAEGVETAAQEEYLRGRGCDHGQGYLYSEAVSASEFVAVAQRLGAGAA